MSTPVCNAPNYSWSLPIYPVSVKDWILKNCLLSNAECGLCGTYHDPSYHQDHVVLEVNEDVLDVEYVGIETLDERMEKGALNAIDLTTNTKKTARMDNHNKTALNILTTQGLEASCKFMFTDLENPKKQLSYSEMRSRYG